MPLPTDFAPYAGRAGDRRPGFAAADPGAGRSQFVAAACCLGGARSVPCDRITPDDVAWACNLLAQLTDNQWRDAFRAGGHQPDDATRLIRKLREKVEQGQALRRTAAD